MKKVLMVTQRFIIGGIEKILLDIFENSDRSKFHYDLLTLTTEADETLIQKLQDLGVGYYSLEIDLYKGNERRKKHYTGLYSFLKENKYDVVHINITSYVRALDMMVVKKAGVEKRIIHAHSANIIDPLTAKILRPMRKFYDYSATDYLACSDQAAMYLFSKKVCKLKKYKVINNGIAINNFIFSKQKRDEVRDRLGINPDTLVIGHVGRITEAKNHLFIIKVFREIKRINKDSKLLLVGDGELRKQMEEYSRQMDVFNDVIFYGSSSEIKAMLSAMDVFLYPSLWEGLGISVVEAQCNGLPCYISENIPNQAIITSNVFQYNISCGPECWANMILRNKNSRKNEVDEIVRAGFDIISTTKEIEKTYG